MYADDFLHSENSCSGCVTQLSHELNKKRNQGNIMLKSLRVMKQLHIYCLNEETISIQ